MKKLIKICGVFIVLLLLAGIVSMALDRTDGKKTNLKDWIWKEEWQTYELSDSSVFDPAYPVFEEGDAAQDFEAGEINSLKISLGGCEMALQNSEDGRFHVTAEEVKKFQAYVQDGILHVHSLDSGDWNGNLLGNGIETTRIVIEIPADTVFESIEISLGAGKFTLASLAADGEVKLELGGGDFSLESLKAASLTCGLGAGKLVIGSLLADSLDCDMGAGQFIVENATVTGAADLDMGMGELTFTGSLPANLDASCSMGQMRFKILGSRETDHNYDLECAAGSLRVGGTSYTGAAGKKIDNGAQTSLYRLVCALGNLEVTFEE